MPPQDLQLTDNIRFEEPICPLTSSSYWSIVIIIALFTLFFATPMIFVTYANGTLMDIVFMYLIIFFISLPFWLILAKNLLSYFSRKAGIIVFQDNKLFIFDGKHQLLLSAPLTDCQWFSGNISWVNFPVTDDLNLLYNNNVLLIEIPITSCNYIYSLYRRLLYQRKNTTELIIIAVGQTNETRFIWEDLFYRFGVKRDQNKELLPSPLSGFVYYCWFFIIIFPSYLFSYIFVNILNNFLCLFNVIPDVKIFPLIIYVVFILISIFLMRYPYLQSENICVNRIDRCYSNDLE
jgi:hypothetical protein